MSQSSDFRGLQLRSFYSDTGEEIFNTFVYPVLNSSVAYDRLTGYFTVSALVAASQGLEGLFRSNGRMRLVIGIHDVPEELLAALALGNLLPSQLVDEYKSRVISEAGFLSDQARKNALSVVGWMIRSGLLEVRVAAPKSSRGIYHQKRMIFRDSFDNVIAGTGSLNETFGGQGNVEEMQFNFSWLSSPSLIEPLVDSFEDIWSGREASVEIFPLDESFATKLLLAIGNPPSPLTDADSTNPLLAKEILRLARSSPNFVPFNLSRAALYPHQERAFVEALSRWPVRVMLADEVGLGKTLEAGSVVSYMIKFGGVESITILAPAGLLRQWQEEMAKHFALDFWRWDSTKRSYISADQTIRSGGFEGTKGSLPPKLRLISAQWARLNGKAILESVPEMIVVDEAHAARVHIDQYGTRTTKLWDLLNELKDVVPHFVLVTATPMQVQPAEYHGLLRILGLAPEWLEFDTYERSLRLIGQRIDKPTMQDGADLADLILGAITAHQWIPSHLDEVELELIMELKNVAGISSVNKSIAVQTSFASYRAILMKLHPAHFLTCRNTKAGLEEFGYRFPKRVFQAPEIRMEGVLSHFESSVETYLTDAYGEVEAALTPDGKISIAFAKSGYYQRMVSSFYASKQSLLRRVEKITTIQTALNSGDLDIIAEFIELDEDEVDESVDDDFSNQIQVPSVTSLELERIVARVNTAARRELSYIRDLLEILDSLGEDVVQSDPKLRTALETLTSVVQKSPALVFSRYTDTLDGFLQLFHQSALSSEVRGFALYTGKNVWIQTSIGRREATKGDVTDALESGEIQIVFCSDAASEGLNLQAAKCILNLDVPWNPARLEQRIGRIARLGQKAAEVQIINFWYPQSIEAKMYARLLSRRDDYQLAVGEFPEIFSSAIREEVSSILMKAPGQASNPIVELQEVRNSYQRIALESVWQMKRSEIPPSQTLRNQLLEYVTKAIESKRNGRYTEPLSAVPGERGSITLGHESLDQAVEITPHILDGKEYELIGFECDSTLRAFGIQNDDGTLRLIQTLSLAHLLSAAAGFESLSESDFFGASFKSEHIRSTLRSFIEAETWLPRHQDSVVPFAGNVIAFPGKESKTFTFKSIGRIRLETAI